MDYHPSGSICDDCPTLPRPAKSLARENQKSKTNLATIVLRTGHRVINGRSALRVLIMTSQQKSKCLDVLPETACLLAARRLDPATEAESALLFSMLTRLFDVVGVGSTSFFSTTMSADYCIDYYPSVCDGYSRLVRAHLRMSAGGNPSCQLAPSHLQCLAQMAITAQPDDVALHSAISAVPAILHRVTCKKVADLDERQQRAYQSVRDMVLIFLHNVERICLSARREAEAMSMQQGDLEGLADNSKLNGSVAPFGPNSEPYPQWKSREEAEIASFVQDLIRVLQHIVCFAQVVEDPTLPDEWIVPPTVTRGEIEGPSIFFSTCCGWTSAPIYCD
ncbi:hypothetical protein NMY22_g14974 [Coprinellus aureogranulatus]|nr:hypothetical protein NMY22_g14974 [Coprinellus aureogranulatus]